MSAGVAVTGDPALIQQFDEAHEFEVPCDMHGFFRCCQGEAAQWVIWRETCPECGYTTPPRLCCDRCKTMLLESQEGAITCNGEGGECRYAFVPPRMIVKRIEPFAKGKM